MLLDSIRNMDLGAGFEHKTLSDHEAISYRGYNVVEFGQAVRRNKIYLDIRPEVFDKLTLIDIQDMHGIRNYEKKGTWTLNCRVFVENFYQFAKVFVLAVEYEINNR